MKDRMSSDNSPIRSSIKTKQSLFSVTWIIMTWNQSKITKTESAIMGTKQKHSRLIFNYEKLFLSKDISGFSRKNLSFKAVQVLMTLCAWFILMMCMCLNNLCEGRCITLYLFNLCKLIDKFQNLLFYCFDDIKMNKSTLCATLYLY
jgi:hypothetical protein